MTAEATAVMRFLCFGNRAITFMFVPLIYTLPAVKSGCSRLKPDSVIINASVTTEEKTSVMLFQADGASPLEALLLQHLQIDEYRQPQIIISLRKKISSMRMTHLITSSCHNIHALQFTLAK